MVDEHPNAFRLMLHLAPSGVPIPRTTKSTSSLT